MDIASDSIEGSSWNDVNVDASTGGSFTGKDGAKISMFMKLEIRPNPYRVRLVSEAINFRKHWDAFRSLKQYPISPAYKKEEKDLDVAWSKGGHCPRKRHAAIVIDRENPKMLRILEAGPQVFKAFGNFGKMTKKNPCGPSGPDWLIKVEKVDGQTSYSVMPDPTGPKPFTAEEITLINSSKVSLKYAEEKFFSRASSEYIRELWEQLPDDKKYSKKNDEEDDEGAQAQPGAGTQTHANEPQKPAPQEQPKPAEQPKAAVKDDGFLKEGNSTPAAQPASPAPAEAKKEEKPAAVKQEVTEDSVSLF